MLPELVTQEVIVLENPPRFAGEEEYGFRHALVREGAYAILPGRDRALGHKLTGEWLERVGEQDSLVLATHFELRGERMKAAYWRAMTAARILHGDDPQAALAATNCGIALDPVGEVAAQSWAIRAAVASMIGGDELEIEITAVNETLRWA